MDKIIVKFGVSKCLKLPRISFWFSPVRFFNFGNFLTQDALLYPHLSPPPPPPSGGSSINHHTSSSSREPGHTRSRSRADAAMAEQLDEYFKRHMIVERNKRMAARYGHWRNHILVVIFYFTHFCFLELSELTLLDVIAFMCNAVPREEAEVMICSRPKKVFDWQLWKRQQL